MDDKGMMITGVKLEISAIDDNKNQEAPLIVFQSRPQPDGKSSISCRAMTADRDMARGLLLEIVDFLARVVGSLPPELPEVVEPDGDLADDYIMVRDLAGEGAEYIKNRLPYGKHMAMLNAGTQRDSKGRLEKVSGEVHHFQKLEPAAGAKEPTYQILAKSGWQTIENIDKYVDEHKLVIYKLHI